MSIANITGVEKERKSAASTQVQIEQQINEALRNTDDLVEGLGNLYYTDARVTAAITAALGGVLPSGSVYNPTLTAVANVAASAVTGPFRYLRVANTVTVSGLITVDPTAASTLTTLLISLPFASAFTVPEQCAGVGACGGAAYAGTIQADAASDKALLTFTPGADVANRTWAVHFTYTVL